MLTAKLRRIRLNGALCCVLTAVFFFFKKLFFNQSFRIPDAAQDRFCLFSLRFSPLGHEIIAGSNDGAVYCVDLTCGAVSKFEGHEDDVNAVCHVGECGNVFASGSDDNLVNERRKCCFSVDKKKKLE